MDFAFTAEQEEFRRTVRRFLDATSPESEVRRLMATDAGYDAVVWKRMAEELGLQGLCVPEALGGSGFGLVELGIVVQEMGRALLCAPFLATTLAASTLLETGPADPALEWLRAIAAGDLVATVALPVDGDPVSVPVRAAHDGASWRLHGEVAQVLDGHVSGVLVVPARTEDGTRLFVVASGADGLECPLLPTVDATRKHVRLILSAVPATLLDSSADPEEVLRRAVDVAATLLAAEQVGVAERALELATDYAKLRTQFGRPIGSFQAVKHKLATVVVELEAARSAAWFALWAAEARDPQFPAAARIANATCSDTGYLAASENVQVHGGIGFTWEHPAHLYLKRALTARLFLGTPAVQRERALRLFGF